MGGAIAKTSAASRVALMIFVAAIAAFGFFLSDQVRNLQEENNLLRERVQILEDSNSELVGPADIRDLQERLANLENTVKDTRRLQGDESLFTCDTNICTAQDKIFRFPKSVLIGLVNPDCDYGQASLSVDAGWAGEGTNCPKGLGSVTFGYLNSASGEHSSVTGGQRNTAEGKVSSVTGGRDNTASGNDSSVTGGYGNTASGSFSSVTGGGRYGKGLGGGNTASGAASSVTGGSFNTASGDVSSVTGGRDITASAEFQSVTGEASLFSCDADRCTAQEKQFQFPKSVLIGNVKPGCQYGEATLSVDAGSDGFGTNCPEGEGSVTFGYENEASGDFSSAVGGRQNIASGKFASVTGGRANKATSRFSGVIGIHASRGKGEYALVARGQGSGRRLMKDLKIRPV